MMDPRDMPTAGDYAAQDAREARAIAQGAANADAASRAELERQIVVLRGQVAFLAGYLSNQFWNGEEGQKIDDLVWLEKIKENKW